MQRASKNITGSVLTTDQSSKRLAPLPLSSLYKCTSPCADVHSHQSPQDFHALCITFSVLLDMVLCRQASYKGTSHNTSLHLTQPAEVGENKTDIWRGSRMKLKFSHRKTKLSLANTHGQDITECIFSFCCSHKHSYMPP